MKKASDPFASVRGRAAELVAQMTREEKAAVCSGQNFWMTHGVERLGLAPVMVTDGPHGLRKQAAAADHLGLNESVPATCFPPACATACAFDPELAEDIGKAMGEECRQENVAVLLGPAANIKRSPLCGRNFEYFSEDPLLSGKTSAGIIRGVQSENVGTSLKHYLANNQEKARLVSNSVIDERALREIYLAGFEIAIKEAQPWTLMCAYNQINDVYASDGPCEYSEKKILAALEDGTLSEEEPDVCATRMTALMLQAAQNRPKPYDAAAHNELARRAARESAVLLKKGAALPAAKTAKIAVVGAFAKTPRYQGAGSSKINPHHVSSLCEALDGRGIAYTYAAGFQAEAREPDEALIAEAVAAAKQADVVFACVGLPDSFESEGYDRTTLAMPETQNALMDALAATGTPVVAVVSTGSAIVMPWRDKVDSILLLYLTGQNGGEAAADLLLGDANPCGKLAESWPLSLEDVPCKDHFACGGNVEYRESVYVGYRYYDKAGKAVQYPFGFGLSYTEFAYSDLTAELDGDTVKVHCTVKNTGDRAGAEVVQLYVAPPQGKAFRPVRELRAFRKVFLQPGESAPVDFTLCRRAFAYYNVNTSGWFVEGGKYAIEIGSSSRDLRLRAEVVLPGEEGEAPDLHNTAPAYYDLSGGLNVPEEQFEAVYGRPVTPWHDVRPFTRNTTLSELQIHPMGAALVEQMKQGMTATLSGNDLDAMITAMLDDMPLRQLAMMDPVHFGGDQLDALLVQLNA